MMLVTSGLIAECEIQNLAAPERRATALRPTKIPREWREVAANAFGATQFLLNACDFPPFAYLNRNIRRGLFSGYSTALEKTHHASGWKYFVSAPDSNRLHSVSRQMLYLMS